ncbi:acriflavin resistance protein [Stappia taiwanensis]|nr:efflux RND transporter periplasmic adaptor subunit [Stappia taiwanensis]GGE78854.1 acriflavin resistance protein [Stappia taiwanensis]
MISAVGRYMRNTGGIALVLVAVGVAACKPQEEKASAAPPPSVQVAAAFKKEIRQSASFVGQIEAVDDVNLLARVSGFLETKQVKDGASVEKDQILFTIEKASYEATLASAKADAEKAEADAALKAADLERDTDLYEKGHVSKAKFQATLATKEQADAAVEAAHAQVKQAELNLGYTDIYAPFPGKIGKTTYSVGDVVGPTSQPLARLVRLAPVYVNFAISEKDYLDAVRGSGKSPEDVRTGDAKIQIHLILPNGKRYGEDGEIVFIDNTVDPKTGTISVRGQFANKDTLLVAGTFVTVVIEAGESSNELLIPQAAIQRDQRGAFVLAIGKQEMVEQRYVELGEQVETDFVVKKGLQEGDRVITEGLQKVRPGVPVNAVLAGTPVE